MMVILAKTQEIHLKCFNNAIIEKQEGGWECRISEAAPGAGIEGACWASDSRQILTYSEQMVMISIFSLVR